MKNIIESHRSIFGSPEFSQVSSDHLNDPAAIFFIPFFQLSKSPKSPSFLLGIHPRTPWSKRRRRWSWQVAMAMAKAQVYPLVESSHAGTKQTQTSKSISGTSSTFTCAAWETPEIKVINLMASHGITKKNRWNQYESMNHMNHMFFSWSSSV